MDVLLNSKTLRLLPVSILLGVLCWPSHAQQPLVDPEPVDAVEETAPYVVFVAQASSFARCGPGEDHYRTDPLRQGQELEVYLETGDGWLGIRPPEDSFCWLPAHATDLSSDGSTATVRDDETVVWIGTQLGRARRYRWQVQLNAGEQVSVIGKMERDGKEGPETWLRIVPPSGEFRWVHRDQVVESAEQLVEQTRIAKSEDRPEDAQQAVAGDAFAKRGEVSGESDLAEMSAGVLQTAANLAAEIGAAAESRDVAVAEESDSSRELSDQQSSRRNPQALQAAADMPDLRPVPTVASDGMTSSAATKRTVSLDRPFQVHRDADPEDFEDRGAVIGSGLRQEWQDDLGKSVLADDASKEAASASVLAEPIRRVTDVVANFISPPRLIQIDASESPNALAPPGTADRRWMVGSTRTSPINNGSGAQAGSTNQSIAQAGSDPNLSNLTTSIPPSLSATTTQGTVSGNGVQGTEILGNGVLQTSFETVAPKARVVSTAQISRAEQAVAAADLAEVQRILSKLMAEGASADELNPLIRRLEVLGQQIPPDQTAPLRETMQRAQQYRNLAARRDGVTTIQSDAVAAGGDLAISTVATAGSGAPVGGNRLSVPATAPPPLNDAGGATGYLVQVYSSRPDSPPFALTDDSGLTVAYVTPYPGVNLRPHLNNRVSVVGKEKMLQGMSTPHILADSIQRR
ncbi:hypothetical protein FYK55_17550 [Roseiconus nitratireducens]|uniref:Secreted protein n=1 Tax=Roseiconus nitratireducens TaxID=2605748 RepID=A0A5M6D1J3_9BACT|nr:hypothetical protein [Roseiconus nitratireducens]KAA5541377.1 hypothetical protein FYK55_17550 [Roseiconus nitratireducens]